MTDARQAVDLALNRIGAPSDAKPEDAGTAVLALRLLTLLDVESPNLGRAAAAVDDVTRQSLVDALMKRVKPDGTVHENQATTAITAAALATWYDAPAGPEGGRGGRAGARGDVAADRVGSRTSRRCRGMRWRTSGRLVRSPARPSDPDAATQAVAAREKGLATQIETLLEQQVIERPVLGPMDVLGGFELAAAPPGTPPNPDWRTAMLLQFLAISARTPGVSDGHNMLGWLLSAGLAGRFMGQLMLDDPGLYYTRSPDDARGGLRMALWDNREAVGPNALALLAVTDLRETIRVLEDRLDPASVRRP